MVECDYCNQELGKGRVPGTTEDGQEFIWESCPLCDAYNDSEDKTHDQKVFSKGYWEQRAKAYFNKLLGKLAEEMRS